jgi:hypothetical protein
VLGTASYEQNKVMHTQTLVGPRSLKIHIFLDIKDFQSTWLADAATLYNILVTTHIFILVTTHIFLDVFNGFSVAQIFLIQLFSIIYIQKFALHSHARQGITYSPSLSEDKKIL